MILFGNIKQIYSLNQLSQKINLVFVSPENCPIRLTFLKICFIINIGYKYIYTIKQILNQEQ